MTEPERAGRRRLPWILVLVAIVGLLLAWRAVNEPAGGDPDPRPRAASATEPELPAEERERAPDAGTTPATEGKTIVRALAIDPTGEPVPGVEVEAAGVTKTTDAGGEVTFEVAAGHHRIGVPDPGWWGGSDGFTAPTEETVRVHVSRGWRLRVVAVDDTGWPVNGARVVVGVLPGPGKTAITDEKGVANIGVCGWCESLWVRVTSESHLAAALSVESATDPGQEVVCRVVLCRGNPLAVRVVEEDGTPVPQAHLYIVHRTSLQTHSETDVRGEAMVVGVATPPSVSVRATARDGRKVERVFPVPADSNGISVEMTMPAGRALAGIVVRAGDGGPVEGAELHFRDPWDRRTVAAKTGPDGRFHVARSPAEGEWIHLWVTAPGLAARSVGVGPEGPERMRVELAPTGSLRGRIVAADGGPVAGVEVMAHAGIGHPAPPRTRTDADGRFQLAGVSPGDDSLILRPEGCPKTPRFYERLEPGETLDLGELRLTRTFMLRATVVDEEGRPVERGYVHAYGAKRAVRHGKFAPVQIDASYAEIAFGGPGYLSSRHRTATPETTKLVLRRPCSVRGRLARKESGQPVVGAEVILRALHDGHTDSSGWLGIARTDEWGRFVVSGLQRGRFEIRVPEHGHREEVQVDGVDQDLGTVQVE